MRIKVKKLWQDNWVSIRSTLVKEAKKNKEPIIVEYQGQEMEIPVKYLESGIENSHVFKSQYGDYSYCLIDFLWKPKKTKKEWHEDLFEERWLVEEDEYEKIKQETLF